jgi:hypothetical protein
LKPQFETNVSYVSFKRCHQALSIRGATGFNLHCPTSHSQLAGTLILSHL